jgi:hypothetical protein
MSTEPQTVEDEAAEPTPGPWKYSEDFAEVQTEDGSRTLAKLENLDSDTPFVVSMEARANGVLMAAAPELSLALRTLFHATADLLDQVTGGKEEEPTSIFEAAERALSEAALALDVAGEPGPSDGGWAGALDQ